MTISQTPTPARSDVPVRTTSGASAVPRPYRTHGVALTVGAVAWSAAIALFGVDPHDPVGLVGFGIGSGAFQVGLMFLLRALWRSRALGEGPVARAALRLEAVVLSLAMTSTLVDAIGVSDLEQTGWLLLDLCWPLSMLGMFLIGIRIAVAGRWRGATRFWPMVAESWAVVTVPTLGILGEDAARVVGGAHLLVGYAVLGVLVSRRTD